MERSVPSLSILQKRVSDSVALGWGLRICMAQMLLTPRSHLENHCSTFRTVRSWVGEGLVHGHTVGLKQNKTQAQGLWLLPPSESPRPGSKWLGKDCWMNEWVLRKTSWRRQAWWSAKGRAPQAGWSQSAAASGLGGQWSDFSDKAEREFPGKSEDSYLGKSKSLETIKNKIIKLLLNLRSLFNLSLSKK